MPLPRNLATKIGRKKAALLLAATKGSTLRLRYIPQGGHEGPQFREAHSKSQASITPNVNILRDPFGEYSGERNSTKFPVLRH